MTGKFERIGMGFLLLWLIANGVGWGVTESVWTALSVLTKGLLPGYLVGGIAGALIGTLQWLVLRHFLVPSQRWITMNLVGWGIGLISVLVLKEWWGKYGLVIGSALTGACVGFAQWFVLRTTLPRSGFLIPLYTIALAYCLLIGFSGSIAVLNWSGFGVRVGMMVLGGVLYGIVSGFALMLLVERALWRNTPTQQ